MLKKSIELAPEEGHAKYMIMGQLCSGKEALDYFSKGIKLLQAETINAKKEGSITKEESFNVRTELAVAYCSVAEIYLTDCCFEPNAEEECEKALKRASLNSFLQLDFLFFLRAKTLKYKSQWNLIRAVQRFCKDTQTF